MRAPDRKMRLAAARGKPNALVGCPLGRKNVAVPMTDDLGRSTLSSVDRDVRLKGPLLARLHILEEKTC